MPWWNDPAALDRPADRRWALILGPRRHSSRALGGQAPRSPTVKVSNIRTTESSVSFDVSRTGVPVMVKTSYYPNWKAEGADGPWRATPNFMVVVPTSHHVRLTFATSTAEKVGRVLTVVGVLGLGGLVWWGLAARRPDDSGVERRRRTGRISVPLHGGEDPRLPVPDSRSTPSSRPMTSAGSIPTRSTSRSPAASATPSCAFTGAGARDRRPRHAPVVGAAGRRLHRGRARSPGPTSSTSGWRPPTSCYFAAGTLDAPAAMFTASHNPAAVQRHQAVPGRGRADRRGHRPGRDQGHGRRRAARAGRGPGPRRAARPAARLRRPRPLVRRPRRARAAAGRGRHRQRHGRPRRPRGVRRPAVRARRSSSASSTAPSRTTRPTRSSRENLKDLQRARARRAAPTSGSRSTATPTASSSSTTRAQPVSGSTTTAIAGRGDPRPAPGRARSCTT